MDDIEWVKKSTKKFRFIDPDLKGWVTIGEDGAKQASSDKKSGQLADVLIKFNKVAQEIGETFGQSKIEEIHIVCEDLTAICLPGKKETFAAIFDKETRPNEFLARYQPK